MFYVLQNESVAARRRCPILLTDSATGTTGQSGLAISSIYPYVSINGGAFAGGAGTIAEVNFGQYYYEFDASEINTLGLAGIHITAPGCRDYDAIVQVAAFNVYSVAGAGLTAGDVWSYGGGRTTTGGIADTVVNPVDVKTTSMASIASTVWNTDVSGYSAPSAGYDLTQASTGGAGISAFDVWNYVLSDSNTAETDLVSIKSDTTSIISNQYPISDIWQWDSSSNTDPSTGFNLYQLGIGATGYAAGGGATAGDVWSYATRTITGGTADTITNPVSVDISSMTGIANTVWSTDVSGYSSPSAGYDLTQAASGSGLTAGAIWDFVITGYGSTGSAAEYVTQTNFTVGNIETYVANQTPQDVWTYAGIEGRTITGGIANTVTTVTNGVIVTTNNDKTGYSLSGTQSFNLTGNITGNLSGSVGSVTSPVTFDSSQYAAIASSVWNAPTRTLTSGGSGISAADVWTYATRTITGGIADTVTTLTDRAGFAITGGTITTVSDKTGYSLSATQTFDLTGNINGNVSGSVGSVTAPVSVATSSMTGIAGTVWSYGTRTLTSGGSGISAYDVWNFVLSDTNTAEVDLVAAAAGAGLTAGDVWSYATRTITGGTANTVSNPVDVTVLSQASIATEVWNDTVASYTTNGTFGKLVLRSDAANKAGDVTLYSAGGVNGIDADIHRIDNDTAAAVALKDILTGIGSTITGNIVGNITGNLSGSVGSVSAGVTVTTNNDKTGYALSGAGVSAVQSGLSTLTQAQVGTEVDSSLADVGLTSTVTGRIDAAVSSRLASASYVVPPTEAAIAGTVWGYATRTLTSGAGATAGDVWTYPTRSLTSGAGITVNAATNIINGPYFVKSNVDGQDGTLDVIRGMVQDIQLTVTDAFQNPFDTTALGLAVNFYDQAGTLVTSYGTSELYGPAGLVQFTLDTAVTANEGRYNLILSAAGSGNTIKFGPLQTLVRPY
jgi:hypothetical protein